MQVVTPPNFEPVSLSEAKTWLKVDYDADDALIGVLIATAREFCEHYCNMLITRQTVAYIYSPLQTQILIFGGVNYTLGVVEVDGVVVAPTVQTMDGGMLMLTLPTAGKVSTKVTITSGYADAASVPNSIKLAMRLMICDWYENRNDNVRRYPTAATNLLNTQRQWIT